MDSTALLRAIRVELDDAVESYFWSDDTLYRYIDEAQKMFCRLEGGIPDMIDVPYAEGDDTIPLDPRVLKIRGAHKVLAGVVKAIPITNLEELPSSLGSLDYGVATNGVVSSAPGSVQNLVSGVKHGALLLHPPSTENALIRLFVFRLPESDITGPGQDLEIQEQHHYSLLYWVKYLALSVHDGEIFQKDQAESYRVKFLEYCALAKRDRERLEHKPRTVVYGGY